MIQDPRKDFSLPARVLARIKTEIPSMAKWTIHDLHEEVAILEVEIAGIGDQLQRRQEEVYAPGQEYAAYRSWRYRAKDAKVHLQRRLSAAKGEIRRRLHPTEDRKLRELAEDVAVRIAEQRVKGLVNKLLQEKVQRLASSVNAEWKALLVGKAPEDWPAEHAALLQAHALLEGLIRGTKTLPLNKADWKTWIAVQGALRALWAERATRAYQAAMEAS